MTIRVLVVDDSFVMRRILSKALRAAPGIEVIGEAGDPFEARDLLLAAKPTVVILDIEMPRMDGLTFLRRLMRYHPIAVVVCSTLTSSGGEVALDAIRAGAVEVVPKPSPSYPLSTMTSDLVEAVRCAASARVSSEASSALEAPTPAHVPARSTEPTLRLRRAPDRRIVAIGASTGGTTAIERMLPRFGVDMPPIVITQHMPAYITRLFAERLNRLSTIEVREAQDGDELRNGLALVAPGSVHLVVERSGTRLVARIRSGPLVSGHRPSVDVLFLSIARAVRGAAIGVLLTGMGRDGAHGLLTMKEAGAYTLAQDEASSVVFGMPKVAIDLDAVSEVAAIERMAERVASALDQPGGTAPEPNASLR